MKIAVNRTFTNKAEPDQFADIVTTFDNRVVPVDNFMIYKDIIRLDRPD